MKITDNDYCERSYYYLEKLKEAGVNTIDLADELAKTDMRKYDVTGHWFPEDALYSTHLLAKELNKYDFEFNLESFRANHTYDLLKDNQKCVNSIYKDFEYIYQIPIPNAAGGTYEMQNQDQTWNGSYEDVFFIMQNKAIEDAYHGFYRISNTTLHTVHHQDVRTNQGKRILIIGDSFNWPIVSYLSIGVEYMDVIHNATYKESIQEYIKETKPDMVLVIYNEVEFNPVYTQAAFAFQ